MTTRRELVRALSLAAAAAALPRALRASSHSDRRAGVGVGVQLYTLRAEMRRNPEATLARIATLGFDEIEWWGEFDRTPAQLRALLDQHNLRAPAAHIDPRDLQPDRLPALLDRAQVMGHTTLIVAWTPPDQRTPDDFKRLGALLSEAGHTAARVGIRTGYHNHDFEFAPHGSATLLDYFLAESDPTVVDLELDCFWAFKAGHDPIFGLRRYADRITHLHIKDSSGPPEHTQMDVGRGVMDWKAIIDAGIAGRVRHVYVEHDAPADAWATVSAGVGHLRALGY
jgi:sugar phosphate isomerase/epimerase